MGAFDLSSDLKVKAPHRVVELELTGLIYLSPLKKINPNSWACFVVCQLYSPLESKLSSQVLALEPAPSIKIWCILDGKQAVKVSGTSAKNSQTLLSSCWFWIAELIYILFLVPHCLYFEWEAAALAIFAFPGWGGVQRSLFTSTNFLFF